MICNDFEDCLKLAKEFLATKERKNYYWYGYIVVDDATDEETLYRDDTVFTDEEITKIRDLQHKYGDDYRFHLNEIFNFEEVCYFPYCDEEEVPESIDLTPHHRYSFGVHEIDGESIKHKKEDLYLSDEDYARLLAWHLFDEHLTMNILYYRDRKLWSDIRYKIDSLYENDGIMDVDHPYLITMDEAIADVEKIAKQYDISRKGWYTGITLTFD